MGTYITNIGLLATPRGHSARRGTQQGDVTLLRNPCSGGGRPGHRRRGTAGDPGTGGRPYTPDLRRVAAE